MVLSLRKIIGKKVGVTEIGFGERFSLLILFQNFVLVDREESIILLAGA